MWNTTTVIDGWYNISVRATDIESNVSQDEVMVHVINHPPLRTIDYYFFDNVPFQAWFFNITYNITDTTVFFITLSSDGNPNSYPFVWIYNNSVNYFDAAIQKSGTLGFIFVNGICEIRFHNYLSSIQDFYITIEITQV
ncbi:hypothetical protein LCGC14_0853960 [marine sediment metagenome]|uniref:Uncharacterized protein n=1 Tax=marine sediment metagenome TaxID=412755 RepID=A0A0F9PUN2_9ZZZZ